MRINQLNLETIAAEDITLTIDIEDAKAILLCLNTPYKYCDESEAENVEAFRTLLSRAVLVCEFNLTELNR